MHPKKSSKNWNLQLWCTCRYGETCACACTDNASEGWNWWKHCMMSTDANGSACSMRNTSTQARHCRLPRTNISSTCAYTLVHGQFETRSSNTWTDTVPYIHTSAWAVWKALALELSRHQQSSVSLKHTFSQRCSGPCHCLMLAWIFMSLSQICSDSFQCLMLLKLRDCRHAFPHEALWYHSLIRLATCNCGNFHKEPYTSWRQTLKLKLSHTE